MNLYDLTSPVETMLANKAGMMKEPLGGTMELTPLCNMNCQMCYIRQDKREMEKQGRMLSCDEWLNIARQAKERGVLFLLLTGGEPLVYPEFERLYMELTHMGFVITINTNGTLINEHYADLFKNNPCRRLNITIYGKDNETYHKLCKNPYGYDQLTYALDLLSERNIPYRLNCTLTPDNINQLEDMCHVALKYGVSIETVSYLFPPLRKENHTFNRLSYQEAAQARLDAFKYSHPNSKLSTASQNTLNTLTAPNIDANIEGITCRAGRSGFWMSWNGDLLPCGMFIKPKISLLEHSFSDCWDYIVKETDKLTMYSKCKACDKRNICHVCAAVCLTESGDMQKKPEYVCHMTDKYYKLLSKYAKSDSI